MWTINKYWNLFEICLKYYIKYWNVKNFSKNNTIHSEIPHTIPDIAPNKEALSNAKKWAREENIPISPTQKSINLYNKKNIQFIPRYATAVMNLWQKCLLNYFRNVFFNESWWNRRVTTRNSKNWRPNFPCGKKMGCKK